MWATQWKIRNYYQACHAVRFALKWAKRGLKGTQEHFDFSQEISGTNNKLLIGILISYTGQYIYHKTALNFAGKGWL